MTQDEAAKAIADEMNWPTWLTYNLVEALVRLGITEFDPPLTTEKKFAALVTKIPFADRTVRGLTEALAAAGLEVVEKRR